MDAELTVSHSDVSGDSVSTGGFLHSLAAQRETLQTSRQETPGLVQSWTQTAAPVSGAGLITCLKLTFLDSPAVVLHFLQRPAPKWETLGLIHRDIVLLSRQNIHPESAKNKASHPQSRGMELR